jgi:hypothetical protein
MRTLPDAVGKVLPLCCGLLGIEVPAMSLAGNHDRPGTFSSTTAVIEIGKPIFHRLKQINDYIIAGKEDAEKLGRFSPIPTAVQGSEQTRTGAYWRETAAFAEDFHRPVSSQMQ